MKPFIEQAQCYSAYQQNGPARYIQLLAIPLIFLSLMILLGFVHIVIRGVLNINLADIAIFVLLIYYFRLNWRLTLALIPIFVILLLIAGIFSNEGPTAFGLWSFILFFIFGYVTEFIGYFLEGKRPPLNESLWRLFIAPLLLIAELFFLAGRMRELKEELRGTTSAQTPVEKS